MRSEFFVHRLNSKGFECAEDVASAFSDLLDRLEAVLPQGRELALVITKLQEACFFAKRALATQVENQE